MGHMLDCGSTWEARAGGGLHEERREGDTLARKGGEVTRRRGREGRWQAARTRTYMDGRSTVAQLCDVHVVA